MRAITVAGFGGPEVLQVGEVDRPVPGPDEVLVRVLAAGVGPWDADLRGGGWTGALPYIPGGEFAGVVDGDSGEDAGFDDRTPVYGYPGLTGCYAQYVVCPVEQMAPLPAGLPITDGATIATPVHADYPDAQRVTWRPYNGQPRGCQLIRMAPWFDDGLMSVNIEARYYYENAVQAHRRVEQGHTRGKLVLIVDDNLANEWEV